MEILPDYDLFSPRAHRRSTERVLHPSKTFPAGRRCERFDCITILCLYNPGPTCFIHTFDEFRPMVAA